jgi:carboxypeptidase family protein
METHNIVWTAADRVKWLVLVGIVAATTAACGKATTGTTSLLGPSQEFVRPASLSYSLSGTILTSSEEGSVPVGGARVEIARRSSAPQMAPSFPPDSDSDVLEAVTDENGRYEFADLPSGRWAILVQKDGYAAASAEVELTDSTSIDIMLEPMEP